MWSVVGWGPRRKGLSAGSLTKKTVDPVPSFGVLVPKGFLVPKSYWMGFLGSWRWMESQSGQGANAGRGGGWPRWQ
jgi:hypothetical protein